ncbi:MAG: glycosyltransferase family 2 protein [Planctomycetota bacterium]
MGKTKNNFNEPLLSVVIPNYNGARFIRDCLKSVLAQEIDGNMEVIVVDDKSPDGSAEIVRAEFPGVRLIENDAKSEFVGSANRGMQTAKGKYVAVLNNDVTVAPGWASAACRVMEEDKEAGAVACKVLSSKDHDRIDSAGQKYCRFGWARRIGHNAKDGPRFAVRKRVFGPVGTAAFYRRDVLEKTGYYEDFFESYYEDADLNHRINRLGYKCVYEPRSVVYHYGSASYASKRIAYCASRNIEYMFFLNSSPAVLAIYLIPHIIFDLAHLAAWTARGRIIPFLRGKIAFLKNLPALVRLRRRRKT